jgi:hypothetical protein
MQIKHRSCFKCQTEIETAETKCHRCGRRLESRTETRVRGSILIILGGFLIVFMGMISSWMINVIFYPQAANGAKFTGDENELLMIAGVFGFVFLFSIFAVITGLWQLIFGRRNRILVWMIIGLGIFFIIGGEALVFFMRK